MFDQAARLRQMVEEKRQSMGQSNRRMTDLKKTRVLCVTSGKGGVGKSNFTINLAITLSKKKKNVLVVDADLGLANIDVIIGTIPKYTMLDVVNGKKNIEEVMMTGPEEIKVISGGSGVLEMIDMSSKDIENFINQLEKVDGLMDFVLIDTGAGLSDSVMAFVMAAEEVVIVTTPEPTSITDAYAMIKTISMKEKEKKVRLLINRVENNDEGNATFLKLYNASKKFLSMEVERLGYIKEDLVVSKSVKKQIPFSIGYPYSEASKGLERIAQILMDEKSFGRGNNSKTFFNRLINFFRQGG